MEPSDIFDSLKKRMEIAIETLLKELKGLRTGRASVNLLEPVRVDCYGTMTPLSQISNISVPESRMLSIQVWDKSNVKAVEKAICNAGLGLNPSVDGSLIRIPVPPLNEERRKDLAKIASKYCEDTKISIRNVRREGLEIFKKQEKNKEISKDDLERFSKEVQKITDNYISVSEDHLLKKQDEIMQI